MPKAPPALSLDRPTPQVVLAGYARLLLDRLEPLEIALGDAESLEAKVQNLLDAAAVLRKMQPEPADEAKLAGLSWPEPGQTVWQFVQQPGQTPAPAIVQLTFCGRDGRMWCVLETTAEDNVRYATRPVLALSPTETGPTYFQRAIKDPGFARSFLQQAGILNDDGQLSAEFGGSDNSSALR